MRLCGRGLLQALVWQAKSDHAEEIRAELEMCHAIAAEHAQSRHQKNLKNCQQVLEQIVDLATKVAEYRLHTGKYVTRLNLVRDCLSFVSLDK